MSIESNLDDKKKPAEAEGFNPSEYKLAINFLEQIPFNKALGLRPTKLSQDYCEFKMNMKDDLIGNFLQGILHGGAISTALDVTGGAMALVAAWQRLKDRDVPSSERPKTLSKLGTIDMRVDFLQPGKGKEFTISATLLRIGNKVAVTRMEFKNEKDDLIAVGTGTYLCG
jgi:acyl-coenzyme A thioesterase PaaI-like protein